MADANPSLSRFIPSTPSAITDEEVAALTSEYTAAYPNFHRDVTLQLQSGDPYATLDGLQALRVASETVARETPLEIGIGDGKCATVLVVALAFFVVLGVAVVRDIPDEGITNEAFAAELASSFAH